MQEEFDRVLDQFREGFRADGFEVAVIEVKPGGVVVVQIQHRPEACEECLIPDDMLTVMFRTAMQRVLPEVTAVELCHEAAG